MNRSVKHPKIMLIIKRLHTTEPIRESDVFSPLIRFATTWTRSLGPIVVSPKCKWTILSGSGGHGAGLGFGWAKGLANLNLEGIGQACLPGFPDWGRDFDCFSMILIL
jgi:hypothetical protein